MEYSDWKGRVGDAWAQEWPRTDRTFAGVDRALIGAARDLLTGVAAPRILDIGCGAGATSLSLAACLADAAITGIDLSPALVAAARSRGKNQPRCRFEQGDAMTWASEADFDLLVSRHGIMFFVDPIDAFAHLRGLAAPGAPLVFSCFRSARENVWASGLAPLMPGSAGDPHAPGPFAFADADHVSGILADAGWRNAAATALDFTYVAGAGADPVANAIEFFTRIGPVSRALHEAEAADRGRMLDGLTDLVEAHHVDGRIAFPAAAWIWSAHA